MILTAELSLQSLFLFFTVMSICHVCDTHSNLDFSRFPAFFFLLLHTSPTPALCPAPHPSGSGQRSHIAKMCFSTLFLCLCLDPQVWCSALGSRPSNSGASPSPLRDFGFDKPDIKERIIETSFLIQAFWTQMVSLGSWSTWDT